MVNCSIPFISILWIILLFRKAIMKISLENSIQEPGSTTTGRKKNKNTSKCSIRFAIKEINLLKKMHQTQVSGKKFIVHEKVYSVPKSTDEIPEVKKKFHTFFSSMYVTYEV